MIIDTSAGTCVLGSNFGRLITTYRDRGGDFYPHQTIGTLHYADDWLLVDVDDEIARYYANQLEKRFGIKVHWRSLWGAHVSAIRGEKPRVNGDRWGHDEGRVVLVKYTHNIYTNGQHWWLNVECNELAEVRGFYGFGTTKRWFHLTVGRL